MGAFPIFRRRLDHNYEVELVNWNPNNVSIRYRKWREGLTDQDRTSAMSTSVFQQLYERRPA